MNTSVNKDTTSLSRREILRIFKRNGYSQAEFAREMGVYESAISQFFKKGLPSARLEKAAHERAQQFLKQERQSAA